MKQSPNTWIFQVLDPFWKFQGQKQRPLEIPHNFFLITLGNSTLFLINLWKYHMLFLSYPWKFHMLNTPCPPPATPPPHHHTHTLCLDFFWNSPEIARINSLVISPSKAIGHCVKKIVEWNKSSLFYNPFSMKIAC